MNGHSSGVEEDTQYDAANSPDRFIGAGKVGASTKGLQRAATWAAYGLLAFMWATWLWWVLTWWLTPLTWFQKWTMGTFVMTGWMDMNEGAVLIYVVPIIVLAIAAHLYLAIPRRLFKDSKLAVEGALSRFSRTILWVGRPFGLVSVGEFLWVATTTALFIWYMSRSTYQRFKVADRTGEGAQDGGKYADYLAEVKWDIVADRFGWLSYMIVLVLLLPVSRGSVLLRVSGISYEQGVKYHRWIAHAHLWLALVHSVAYWVLWLEEGVFWKQAWRWQKYAINNLAGEIDMFIGLAMWLTALGPVRRKSFEVFFYTHQMYLLYFLFLFFHAGEWAVVYALPSLILFGADRLLRAVQSHATVRAHSVTLLPDGCFEITIPTASGVKYKPLDNIFVNVPAVSHLQWHPFSVTSSALDGLEQLAVIVKPGGTWTRQLASHLEANPEAPLQLRVEGPYGQEQSFCTRYDDLVLVAGGIGITPFFSLLRDLAYRCRMDEPGRPKSVTLLWAVHKTENVALLQTLDLNAICPDFARHVQLNVQVYVTKEEGPHAADVEQQEKSRLVALAPAGGSACPMHALVGQGADLWAALLVLVVSGGTFLVLVVFIRTVVHHYDHESYAIFPYWARVLVYFGGVLVGLLIFVALAAAAWYYLRPSTYKQLKGGESNTESPVKRKGGSEIEGAQHLQPSNVHYGSRPKWDAVFTALAQQRLKNSNAGVLVSGPPSMEHDVALRCSRLSRGRGFALQGRPQLNFHSITFNL